MTPYLARVIWNDAQGSATEVFESRKHHAPVVMATVGWITAKDRAGVSICCEQWTEDGAVKFRGHTYIPAGMVVRIVRLIPQPLV